MTATLEATAIGSMLGRFTVMLETLEFDRDAKPTIRRWIENHDGEITAKSFSNSSNLNLGRGQRYVGFPARISAGWKVMFGYGFYYDTALYGKDGTDGLMESYRLNNLFLRGAEGVFTVELNLKIFFYRRFNELIETELAGIFGEDEHAGRCYATKEVWPIWNEPVRSKLSGRRLEYTHATDKSLHFVVKDSELVEEMTEHFLDGFMRIVPARRVERHRRNAEKRRKPQVKPMDQGTLLI